MEGGSHQTALHLSLYYATLSAVKILTSYGADINAVDSRGMTPLHMAAGMLRKDVISYLIRQGADFNAVSWLVFSFFGHSVLFCFYSFKAVV